MALSSHHEKLASKAADFSSAPVPSPTTSVSPTPSDSRIAIRVPSETEVPSSKEVETVNAELATEAVEGTIVETANGERIYVEFVENDPRNPINFSRTRKWVITITTSTFICAAVAGSSSYALGWPSMTRDLHTTNFKATAGISTFTAGYAIVPLLISSISEEFGRHPIYVVTTIGFMFMHLGVALADHIRTVLIVRFFGGVFGSGSILAAGTIADLWDPHERGLPMAIFSFNAVAFTGLGPVFAGYVEQNPHLEWRWIQWIHLILCGVLALATILFSKETRSDVILSRLARKLRKETGDPRFRARVEDERASLRTRIYISVTRPFYFMFTEPAVASFSLWVGFAWGITFVLIESIAPVFKTLHNFSQGSTGLVFITFFIGSSFGMCTNIIQERLYAKHVGTHGPEARLYHAMFAAILFPIAMYIYAWCTFPDVPWIALAIGITLFIWATFIMFLTVFNYLAECYGPFASSALGGQALCRNAAAAGFPLFTQQMYSALTYHWANTMFANIATLMIPIPFVLYFYGPQIRARSKFASQVKHRYNLSNS
ncbi:hypothetical protein EIP91_003109 [Steccherinum ochraceum]|uniref:Major facilitator superfamily (MFS) profile domain-containing protein n=1 Tax=Steccherinum ochraceum TaxID=92696 RepID=A0A4R0RUM8_9APHY|nr:hypothetical protein EIP91_003109 [Steccherinum ochraceum]